MIPRNISFIVLLSAGAIGSWYLAHSNIAADDQESPYEAVHRGYYLKQVRILGTGEDGDPLYEIDAKHAEQQDDKRVEFSNVQIRYSPNSDVPWVVSADEATLQEGTALMTLRGHVQILNDGSSAQDTTEIRTRYLDLDARNFIAETEQRVQIRFGSRSVMATGMLAFLHDDRIELKANVRGKIVP